MIILRKKSWRESQNLRQTWACQVGGQKALNSNPSLIFSFNLFSLLDRLLCRLCFCFPRVFSLMFWLILLLFFVRGTCAHEIIFSSPLASWNLSSESGINGISFLVTVTMTFGAFRLFVNYNPQQMNDPTLWTLSWNADGKTFQRQLFISRQIEFSYARRAVLAHHNVDCRKLKMPETENFYSQLVTTFFFFSRSPR